MTEIESLQRKKVAARNWVKHCVQALTVVTGDPGASLEDLEEAVTDFDKQLAVLDEIQAEVELAIDQQHMETNIEEAFNFRKQARQHRTSAMKRMSEAAAKTSIGSDDGLNGLKITGNIPEVNLPTFSGELTEWQSFWEKYEVLVDKNSELSALNKFNCLQSLLEGEAKLLIQRLPLTDANYVEACKILKENYGRKEKIIMGHVQALLNASFPLQANGMNYVTMLWELKDLLVFHIRRLQKLGVDGSVCGALVTPIVLSRLPLDIHMEWSKKSSGKEGDLEYLISFLQREIERGERRTELGGTFTEGSNMHMENKNLKDSEKKKVKSASFFKSPPEASCSSKYFQCWLCNKKHKTEKCYDTMKLPLEERKKRVRAARLCFKCLEKGHLAPRCMYKCSVCSGNHNALLCPRDKIKLSTGRYYREDKNQPSTESLENSSIVDPICTNDRREIVSVEEDTEEFKPTDILEEEISIQKGEIDEDIVIDASKILEENI